MVGNDQRGDVDQIDPRVDDTSSHIDDVQLDVVPVLRGKDEPKANLHQREDSEW